MVDFTSDELATIHAALILYRAELRTQDLSTANGFEANLRNRLVAAAGTAMEKVVEEIRGDRSDRGEVAPPQP